MFVPSGWSPRRGRGAALGAVLLLFAGCIEPGPDSEAPTGRAQERMGMGMGAGTPTQPAADPSLVPLASEAVAAHRGYISPTRLALGPDGKVFVSDTGAGLVTFLDPVTGRRGDLVTDVRRPLGIAVFDPATSRLAKHCVECGTSTRMAKSIRCRDTKACLGMTDPRVRLYVGDESDGSVRIVAGGALVGKLGKGAGEFRVPNAIAVTSQGWVYVVDSGQRVVKVYSAGGGLSTSFGATRDGSMDFPNDIAINEAVSEVYVSDFDAGVVHVFDLKGVFLRTLSPPANDQGAPIFQRPAGLGLAPDGNLLVVDNGLGCVVTITPAGALVRSIGYRKGRYWTGDLVLPIDAVSDGKHVVVSSNRARQLVVFEVTP